MTALALDVAQQRLLALAKPLDPERIKVRESAGRFLAEPLIAARTQPAANVSAMDGYAVSHGDMAGPWKVVGESAAGHPFAGYTNPGEATRISTGALLPAGADTVIVQEDVAQEGGALALKGTAPVPHDKHVRKQGTDFNVGTMLLPHGTRLGPRQVALTVSSGCTTVSVHRAAKVTLIDCGDELAYDQDCYAAHQIPASNAPMLQAMVADLPCEVTMAGPIRDDERALAQAFEIAGGSDVIVTTGGASVGDHDVLKPALTRWGADIDVWRVAIKPGKPLVIARRGRQIVLGLPGNPAAAFVTAHLFLLPLLRKMQGTVAPLPRAVLQTLTMPLPPAGARREFVRGRWYLDGVAPLQGQDSGALGSLAAADVLIDRPALAPAAAIGTRVSVHVL